MGVLDLIKMSDNKKVTIVLLGATGEGKSSFGNYILKYEIFKESNNSESCTENIKCCQGKKGTEVENLFIIDTPGTSDSKGRDEIFIKQISKELKDNYRYDINSFLLLFNINKTRLSFDIKKQLYYYCLIFPIKDFWSHVGIVFTFSYDFFNDNKFEIMKENKIKGFMLDFIETIKSYIKEINCLNGYNIIPPENVNVFFTDCGEIEPPYTHKRTDMEIKKIIEWSYKLNKLDLSSVNTDINLNYKYYKQIEDLENEEKIFINENKYKIINKYTKRYKTIDFQNNEEIILDSKCYKSKNKYYKLFKDKKLINKETKILNDNFYSEINVFEHFQRWNEVDSNNKIINYGKKENIHQETKENIIKRNWKVFNTEYKTEYDHIISYDYEFEHEKYWVLFIPIHKTYKQPYRLVQNIYYKKEDKIDDLGYKKYGDWFIYEYGSTRKDYYTSKYLV